MDNFEQELLSVENDLKSFRLQRYLELPDIDLYMEQVISYVNRHLEIFNRGDEYLITPSMINNYVKYGIIPPPDKKKYKRKHIAYVYAVYFLKQVLTMSEIKDIICHQVKTVGERTAYEFFCNELERAIKNCCRSSAQEEAVPVENYALKYSAIAIANKLYAQRVIELQREPAPEPSAEEKKTEKDKKTDKTEKKAEKEEKKAEKTEKKAEKKKQKEEEKKAETEKQ